jgi:hypothetical protein
MTVQELIDALQGVEDKTKPVSIWNPEWGMADYTEWCEEKPDEFVIF